MTKHTPGPWFQKVARTMTHLHSENGTMIGSLELGCTEKEANARLIAAAPELLASCTAMMGYMEDGFLVRNTKDDVKSDWAIKALAFVQDLNVMHTAIAKASGKAESKAA